MASSQTNTAQITSYATSIRSIWEHFLRERTGVIHTGAVLHGVLLSLALLVTVSSLQAQPGASFIAITHVAVVDPTGGPTQAGVTVLIRDRTIAAVGKRVVIPPGAKVIDASGDYAIPGLWDMHVHSAFGDWFPRASGIMFPLFIANGVTGIRDMGSILPVIRQWRDQVRAGKMLGPRIVFAGPMLDGPKPPYPASIAIRTPAQARMWVGRLKQQQVDFIKVQSVIPRDAYFAVADEAKKQRISFVGHVPDSIRAVEASDAGQRSIEHFTGIFEACSSRDDGLLHGPKGPHVFVSTFSEQKAQELIRHLAKNWTWQVPTLVTEHAQWLFEENLASEHPLVKYVPEYWEARTWRMVTRMIREQLATDPLADRQKFFQMELKMAGEMRRAGIPFLAGTDTAPGPYVIPGFSLHDELAWLVDAGFKPIEALQAATINPARFLGLEKQLGSIEPGKLADLVLLKADPLQDIRNTRQIVAVIADGRLFQRKQIDEMLQQVVATAGRSRRGPR
jgi:hypothetical protein